MVGATETENTRLLVSTNNVTHFKNETLFFNFKQVPKQIFRNFSSQDIHIPAHTATKFWEKFNTSFQDMYSFYIDGNQKNLT